MDVKLFEIRDRATTVPMLAIRLGYTLGNEAEKWLLERAGYGVSQLVGEFRNDDGSRDPSNDIGPEFEPYILLVNLVGEEAHYDPYSWRSNARTFPEAHRYLIDQWDELSSGDIIDVEFILGETPAPKTSDRLR